MDIAFNCGSCGQHVVIDEKGAGITVQCPKCNQTLTVPRTKPAPSKPPTPAPDIQHPKAATATPPKTVASVPETKQCPFCAETIRAEATKCKHCGSILAKPPKIVQHAGKTTAGSKPGKFSCPNCQSSQTHCERDIGCAILIICFISCGLGFIMIPFLPYNCDCLDCGFKWKS